MRNEDKGVTNAIIKVSGGISSTKHHDMKLYFAIAPGIALSALFATAPVKADSALIRHSIDYQGPKIHEIGRSIGWIQAACFFARPSGIKNKISPDMAKMTIETALNQVAMRFGKKEAMEINKDQFKLNTKCQHFWPTRYMSK